MLLLTFIHEHNEIPICDDIFKYALIPYLTIYDLLRIVTTNKQFKKLIQNIIPDHPYNLHNAIWEGPKLNRWKYYYCNPFILPENPQNYIWVGANLEYTNIEGANLENANLSNVKLLCSCISDANLRNANLRNANVVFAIFTRVILEGIKTNNPIFHKQNPETILII
jgi:uncharacterized protein YjbI with pentapeptide repeats